MRYVILASSLFLTACGSGGGGSVATQGSITAGVTTDAAFDAAVQSFVSELVDIGLSPVTTSVPSTGSATFTGGYGADYDSTPTGIGSFIGDLSITTDFGAATLSGNVTNLVSNDGVEIMNGGSVTMSGSLAGGTINGTVSGNVTVPNATTLNAPTTLLVNSTLAGDFHGTGTTITGVSGISTQNSGGVQIDGFFYGR